jgi:hypothetical protein
MLFVRSLITAQQLIFAGELLDIKETFIKNNWDWDYLTRMGRNYGYIEINNKMYVHMHTHDKFVKLLVFNLNHLSNIIRLPIFQPHF